MAPSATEPSRASGPQDAALPLHLYDPRELHFEKFIEPRSDGYRKAASQPAGAAAIVIDNGNYNPPVILTVDTNIPAQDHRQQELAGLSKNRLD